MNLKFLAQFWPIFPVFWAKEVFLKNLVLSRKTSFGFLAPCQNLEKTNNQFQENTRTEGRMERPYFVGPIELLPLAQ